MTTYASKNQRSLPIGFANLPNNVRVALYHPYFQARDGLCQFSQSWSRFEALQQQMDELKKQLKGHLQSLVNRYLRFVRQGTRPRRYPDDLNPENPFFRLDGMFDQKNANKKDEILAPTMGNQRRHIRSVIRIKEALVALLWVIYEDACKWFCKEHDAKTGNIYAWAQMQPMLKTANDFLGNVQQMTNAMHRCIDKAAVADAYADARAAAAALIDNL